MDKTESIKNISKRNKENMEREKEGVRKIIYAKVKKVGKRRETRMQMLKRQRG